MSSQKFVVEFIGTFFLVLVVSFTGNPLAIGAVLAALVYSGGHVSGAHFNPAVTLALYLKKKIHANDAMKYVLVQLLGGFCAAIIFALSHHAFFIPKPTTPSLFIAFIVELFFTFLLARTILLVAADDRVKNNQYFGIAIGAALLAGAAAGGPISGGAFNPAVGFAPLLLDAQHLTQHVPFMLLYIFGPLIGGALAAFSTELKN